MAKKGLFAEQKATGDSEGLLPSADRIQQLEQQIKCWEALLGKLEDITQ